MKKFFVLISALLLVLLCACGSAPQPEPTQPAPQKTDMQESETMELTKEYLIAHSSLTEEDLADCAFLGAYIKRRCNLALLAEGTEALSTEELGLAVRESLAYLSLRGMLCDLHEKGETRLAAEAVTAAYDAFEDAAEQAVIGGEASDSLLVTMIAEGADFSMTMLFDGTPPALSGHVEKACAAAGLTAERWTEDGAGYLRLRTASVGSEGREGDAS